jgi:uncharacterized protein YgbK (DUF1537 family)
LVVFGIAVEERAEVAVGALPEWGFTRVSGAVYFHGVPLAESGDIGRAKETALPLFETLPKGVNHHSPPISNS